MSTNGGGRPIAEVLSALDGSARAAPWAIVVGPEAASPRPSSPRCVA